MLAGLLSEQCSRLSWATAQRERWPWLLGGGAALDIQPPARSGKFRTYHWPIDRREPPDAKLHAEAVIVDGHAVLLTSANMTSAAYSKNIELGVLCRGGGVAAQVQRHFDGLIGRGILSAGI